MRRSHALRAAVTATVIELVIVAGVANQWSTRAISRSTEFDQQAPLRVLRQAMLSLSWRFTPQHGRTDAWLGAWIGDVVLVVLTFAFVYLVVAGLRRPAPFFAGWLAGWALVLLATVVDAVVAVVIGYPDISLPDSATGWRFWDALTLGPTSAVVVFGLASGLVAGLGAAIAARSAGALPQPAPPVLEPEPTFDVPPPPPWYGETTDVSLPPDPATDATQALPRVSEEQETQQLPVTEPAPRGSAGEL